MGLAMGNLSIDPSNCRMAHDLVFTDSGNLTIEADAVVVDPYYVSAIGSQHHGCYAQAHYSDLRDDFPDMNQMTRRGSDWRNFVESGDLSAMEFSLGATDCRALEKRGPTWLGGHTYVIHASVCRKDGRNVDAADVEFALGSLQVRLYEPRGNLRPPPQ
jgi:broad specificity phosphatase PhoE